MNGLPPRSILVVDRNPRNRQLLLECLAGSGYEMRCAADLAQLDEALARPEPIGLALVDVDGFDLAVWERCRRLHERKVAVLVVVGRCAVSDVQFHGLQCGACAVLAKPLSWKRLAQMVRGLLEVRA